MITYLRYALATFCLAASVGCLGLWGWSVVRAGIWYGVQPRLAGLTWDLEMCNGTVAIVTQPFGTSHRMWTYISHRMSEASLKHFTTMIDQRGRFGATINGIYFPLWYPALIFALAGVGVVRFRRQFSIRSALVVVSVVAALLGTAVVL